MQCPLCAAGFGFEGTQPNSLKCKNGHTYDFSKKGYVNLFGGYTKITKTYDKKLFCARKTVSDLGLYAKLCETLCEIIGSSPGSVLDAGCGCGNLSADIFYALGRPPTFGLDLSRDGIDFAASNFCESDLFWIVANLNNLPLSDEKFDIVTNIMAPANYLEFKRVLKPGGILVKVLPDSSYLKELRHFIYKENDKNEYSNKEVLENLAENMDISDIVELQYSHAVSAKNIPALFDMTPLTQNIGEKERLKDELSAMGELKLTLAFKIAICR